MNRVFHPLVHVEGRNAVGVRLGHVAHVVGAELDGNALDGIAVGIIYDHAVAVKPVLLRLGCGRAGDLLLTLQKCVDGLLILFHGSTFDGCAEDLAGLVHEEAGRVSSYLIQDLSHVLSGDKVHIADLVFRQKVLRCFQRFLVVGNGVLYDADDAAALIGKALVDFTELSQFAAAGAAPGAPVVHHGDFVFTEKLFAGNLVAVYVNGLKIEGQTDHRRQGIDRRIKLAVLQNLGKRLLQSGKLISIFLVDTGDILLTRIGPIKEGIAIGLADFSSAGLFLRAFKNGFELLL